MNIGKMNKRLQIVKNVKVAEDEGFGEKYDWQTIKTVWTEQLKQRITPIAQNGDGESVVVTQGFKVRKTDISKGYRVICNNITYDVVDVDTSDNSCYVLTCKVIKL